MKITNTTVFFLRYSLSGCKILNTLDVAIKKQIYTRLYTQQQLCKNWTALIKNCLFYSTLLYFVQSNFVKWKTAIYKTYTLI